MNQRLLKTLARIGTVLAILSLTVGAGAQTSSTQATTVPKQLAIMSRIIEDRLGGEWKDQVITSSMFQRGVQGFYVRGIGALFFVDVKFPVAEPPAKPTTTKTGKPGDLWDRYENEMERKERSPVVSGETTVLSELSLSERMTSVERVRVGGAFDKAKVERLQSALLAVLAEYGRRIEALGNTERIVVVICGSSPSTIVATSDGRVQIVTKEIASVTVEERATRSQKGSTVKPVYRFSDQRGRGSVLTISVERRDLVDDPKELAKRAKLDAYCY